MATMTGTGGQAGGPAGGTGGLGGTGGGWDPREWMWVRVLSGALYGLRPGRVGLAFFALVLIGLLLEAGRWIDSGLRAEDAIPPMIWPLGAGIGSIAGGAAGWFRVPWDWFVMLPIRAVEWWPVTTLVFVPLALFVWLIAAGAISRIAACEIGLEKHISWTEGLAYSLKRWKSLVGAVLGPVLLIWLLALLAAVFGFLLLRWPWVNVLGAVLFPLVLIGAVVAAALGLVYVIAQALLVPSVACDGSDAIDAIQRAYAYVVDRPVRMIVFLLLALVGVLVTVAVVAVFVWGALYFAAQAAGLWAGEAGRAMVGNAVRAAALYIDIGPVATPMPGEGPGSSFEAAGGVIRFWSLILSLLVPAALLSCLVAAATMLYLAMRKVCDGQDVEELWWPGKVDEAMGASMAARAKAAGGGEPPAADLAAADYE